MKVGTEISSTVVSSLDDARGGAEQSGLLGAGASVVSRGFNRQPRTRTAIAASICALLLSAIAASSEKACFVPLKGSGDNSSLFVEPKSKVCRAFQKELNANCDGDIPNIEFKPRIANSGLTEPDWKPIPLYTASGVEDPSAFALLEKLVWAQATTRSPLDREARAKRDMELVLGQVRTAHASGRSPRFEQVSLDLEGRGKEEVLYRLYSGVVHNARSINESSFKTEPTLFLERAVRLTSSVDISKISPNAAGNQMITPADVLLFEKVPYLLTWTGGNGVLIYASYLRPGRQNIPDENREHQTFIIPTLRCMFEARPIH